MSVILLMILVAPSTFFSSSSSPVTHCFRLMLPVHNNRPVWSVWPQVQIAGMAFNITSSSLSYCF